MEVSEATMKLADGQERLVKARVQCTIRGVPSLCP
jgi:hypothetical protein